MGVMLRRLLPWCGVAAVLGFAVPAASADPGPINTPGTALHAAVAASPLATDVVTIYNTGSLRASVSSSALAAARDAGGTAAFGRSAAIGMRRVLRGSDIVQAAPSGFAYPMSTTVLPNVVVGRLMGREVSAVLNADTIVMSALTAGLRGAQAGDRVELIASSGATVTLTIGAVVDDAITGGTELVLSPATADRLGVHSTKRVVIWGFSSRAAIEQALADRGLISTSIRVRKSWDPFDPDLTLGYARTKEALGEFAYRVNSNGSVTLESAWESANITSGSVGQSPYRLNLPTGCHSKVRVSLAAAMNELIATGNADSINYGHANTAGGCFVRRFNRLTQNSAIGYLSRHTWGMAVDTNTLGSCQGCAPPDFVSNGDCDTIRIFRKHGFAWGGNFLTPDGMHFEWVGEPRDQFAYPSRYCPNTPSGAPPSRPGGDAPAVEETARATLFTMEGLEAEHGHHD